MNADNETNTAGDYDHLQHLRDKRKKLKEALNDLDAELGEGRADRAWLRKLPDWYWYPVYWTSHLMRTQTASKRTPNADPTLYHWARHADLAAFGINLTLGVIYIAIILTILGALV